MQRASDERQVFGGDDQPDVHDDAGRHKETPRAFALRMLDRSAEQEIAGCGGGDDREIHEVPLRVEEIIGEQDHRDSGQARPANCPIKEEDSRQ